uniref:Sugar phosphate transporter domain-containing protein n=1 Tax=Craspedostauros australis TaxID=1486917 RepID=A0A7R9ZMF3_9STRA
MTKKSLNHALLITTSAFYVFAMIGSNEALRFVSYPTAVLAKSCKLLPTMIMGTIIERRVYSKQQWTSALAISVGMSLFHISRLQQTSTTKSTASSGDNSTSEGDGSDVNTDDEEDGDHSWKGMALLIWSLTCDGFLGSCQGLLKRVDTKGNQRPPSAVETMLYMNIYALFFLIPVAMISGQWQQGVHLLQSDGQLRMAIFILNLVVSVGQIFIFLTVTWYSSLACTTITTTRKFITILLSVIYFGHKFSMMQWCAVGLVFGGLYLATVSKQFAGTPRQVTAEDADKTKKMQ